MKYFEELFTLIISLSNQNVLMYFIKKQTLDQISSRRKGCEEGEERERGRVL